MFPCCFKGTTAAGFPCEAVSLGPAALVCCCCCRPGCRCCCCRLADLVTILLILTLSMANMMFEWKATGIVGQYSFILIPKPYIILYIFQECAQI